MHAEGALDLGGAAHRAPREEARHHQRAAGELEGARLLPQVDPGDGQGDHGHQVAGGRGARRALTERFQSGYAVPVESIPEPPMVSAAKPGRSTEDRSSPGSARAQCPGSETSTPGNACRVAGDV